LDVREVSFRTGAIGLSMAGGGGATGSAFSIFGFEHIGEEVFFLIEEHGSDVSDHSLLSDQSPKLTVGNL
jgi:hypothetical protein